MRQFLFALLTAAGAHAAVTKGKVNAGTRVAPAAAEEHRRKLLRQPANVVQPLKFNQRLLICNAYPSNSSMTVQKNEKEMLADVDHAIAFRECRYIDTRVQSQDKLDLSLAELDVEGTFEVGELPESDAVLLLVLKKRPGSTLVSFQSFAFPPGRGGTEAQVAVIDAFGRRNATQAHLKMEDHISGKEKKASLRRVEELNFNRVYAVEEGTYDATVMERFAAGASELVSSAKHVMRLARNQNYVVLRTGDDEVGEPEDIVVYPNAKSAGLRVQSGAFAVLAAMAMAFSTAVM
eukprot:TRINITY_DN56045_c0_g1_i1.p1 TRINITY_DN56045_c0_g1~~TRINITY_DN56045_c0_g1_i1.p1  ORF type:complete len:292 (+),score=73.58 TRINITY_DN56045_c0_g1_i1:66-941(+)